ncbi:Transcription factor SOX-17 [Coemansia sp. IMI 209128]|nr:Transcription factor SOX-17 [Coemansia sp. IMI 209128]
MDQSIHLEQLSADELAVIHQLRRLQQVRSQHIPVVGRHEPLGMITFDARQYLEIRQGFSPILVPSHMLHTVRTFISDNLPRHMQAHPGRQALSPPQTPHSLPPPTFFPMTPVAEQPTSPQATAGFSFSDNAPSSLSGLSAALAQGTGSFPLQPQYSMTSPLPPLAGGAVVSPSSMPSLASAVNSMSGGLGLASAPSYMDTDRVSPLLQEDSSQAAFASPPAGTNNARKPSAAKSRKTTKASGKLASLSPPPPSHKSGAGDYFSGDESESVLSNSKDGSKKRSKQSTDDAEQPYELDPNDVDMLDGEDDGECHLRKPPNAFILYRQAQNLKLRKERPGLSVEAASIHIGARWKEEDVKVKLEYKEKADLLRDEYFAKKKRIQAAQKARKIEREELTLASLPRAIAKPRRQTSGSKDLESQLVVASARDLGSFSPESLAPMSAMSHHEFAAIQEAPVARPTLSLSVDIDTRQVFGHPQHLSSSGAGSSSLTPMMNHLNTGTSSYALGGSSGDPNAFFGDASLSESAAQSISQQVATSLEHLKAAFSESPPSSSLTAMAIDSSPPKAPCTTAEWASTAAAAAAAAAASVHPTDHGGWEGMLNSLFQKAS